MRAEDRAQAISDAHGCECNTLFPPPPPPLPPPYSLHKDRRILMGMFSRGATLQIMKTGSTGDTATSLHVGMVVGGHSLGYLEPVNGQSVIQLGSLSSRVMPPW
ncbi:hypothetical protein PAMP_021874 [Pampus punctatissimus]